MLRCAHLRAQRAAFVLCFEVPTMSRYPSVAFATASLFVLSLALAGAVGAQTHIAGNIYDGSGGPLLTGVVYVATGHLTVPVGQTLTVQGGAIVKFQPAIQMTVDGTLLVNGTTGNRAVFTAYADDDFGGDTNGNGPSSGTPGTWRGLLFNADSDASVVAGARVRYWGYSSTDAFELTNADITVTDSIIELGSSNGMDLHLNSLPTVSGCDFGGNGLVAVDGAMWEAVPGFTNNTATGNGGNYIQIPSTTPAVDVTVVADNCLGGALHPTNHTTVPAGVTLTLEAGVIIKPSTGLQFAVDGTLIANGTLANPVVFTAFEDDDWGGDTNNNGPSSGTPGQWRGLIFNAGAGASTLTRTLIRYFGYSSTDGLELSGADITVTDSTIENGLRSALDLQTTSNPTVSGCSFLNNASVAVAGATFEAVQGFSGNAASGNGGNYIRLESNTITSDVSIVADNCLEGALVVTSTHAWLQAGWTLTLGPGVVLKFTTAIRLIVDGTLLANGTAANPVVFTDYADDDFAGDTHNNGPSSGTPGQWRGLVFNDSSDASVLTQTRVRFTGYSSTGGLDLFSADITVTSSVIGPSNYHGIELNGSSYPSVSFTDFVGIGQTAVMNANLAAVGGFRHCTATGGANDFIRVTSTTVAADVVIGPENMLGGAVVANAHQTIPAGVRVTLRAGSVVKFYTSYQMIVNGALDLLGTAYDPVVMTALADDAWGGDTNGDGPSVGVPGTWRGITWNAGPDASLAENALVRFTGYSSTWGVNCANGSVKVRSVRVEHSNYRGMTFSAHDGPADNLVVFDCASYGLNLTAGSFPVRHATVTGVSGTGIINTGTWSGVIQNAISWNNTTANYSGIPPTSMLACNGDATASGANGNINLDPQFMDPSTPVGDLSLQSGSPCIDTADALAGFLTLKDHDERSRLLDYTQTGAMFPDMGAYEKALWEMTVTGVPRMGTQLSFSIVGPPGDTIYAFGPLDGSFLILPFGLASLGDPLSIFVFPFTVPVGLPLVATVPTDPVFEGVELGIQALTISSGFLDRGHITSLYRATFYQ